MKTKSLLDSLFRPQYFILLSGLCGVLATTFGIRYFVLGFLLPGGLFCVIGVLLGLWEMICFRSLPNTCTPHHPLVAWRVAKGRVEVFHHRFRPDVSAQVVTLLLENGLVNFAVATEGGRRILLYRRSTLRRWRPVEAYEEERCRDSILAELGEED